MSFTTPSALNPIYSTREPNQPIQLYQGSLEIAQGNNTLTGNGRIFFRWFPSPTVEFEFLGGDYLPPKIELDEAELRLLDFKIPTPLAVFVTKIHPCWNFDASISGSLKEPAKLGVGDNLSCLLFHLTNFHNIYGDWISADGSSWRGRVILEDEGWRVTIDSLKTVKSIINYLNSQGGYSITHVVKLERVNQAIFSTTEAEDFLNALSFFLSFSRGIRTSAILSVGYNINGDKVWEEWNSYIAKPWQKVHSWFPDSNSQSLSEAFPGFMHRWQSNTWNEPIRRVIHWYEESNARAGGVEGSIILLQAALELLAWVCLVEEGVVSKQEFTDKKNTNYKSTSRKINRLFKHLKIPTDIPTTLLNLVNLDSKNNGPYLLTEVRNNIVHAAPENRLQLGRTSRETLIDAYELGQWYLELALLRLFQYRGVYLSRVERKPEYKDNIVPVP